MQEIDDAFGFLIFSSDIVNIVVSGFVLRASKRRFIHGTLD